jgi:hypothetical protein
MEYLGWQRNQGTAQNGTPWPDTVYPWEEVIHKRVKTTDDVDMGDTERVGNDFIVVREGVANVRLYYIPKANINNYDGSSIYVAVPSGLVSAKFEKGN